ncbi:MAG: peptide ABC transporter permease [Gammaproteobacteria bacterium RIFCSPLOWO2_12_FULL_52_10]|nr:MAG: peptide ABC transporter permease [Gammaproteobacteria bacterium RIFCSPLOWO2_12_FULL_52_10]
MRTEDTLQLAARSILANRLRTLLIVLGVAIGVSAVIVLTALGDSARRYITGEFSELGTNMIAILPGRSETTGGPPPLMGETPRDLTIDDALALARSPLIKQVAPLMLGSAPVAHVGLEREVTIFGTTAAMQDIRKLTMAQGQFLPDIDPHLASPVCVIGEQLASELFGNSSALGQWIRIGDRRFRVYGIIAKSGVSLGADLDDMAFIPVASAAALFNTQSLFRILTEARMATGISATSGEIRRIIKDRHEGEDDITIVAQDSIIATFDRIMLALTLGIAGIAAISLAVAGILIMNIMLVTVTQRTEEIGLLKALGAPQRQIRNLFLTEALLLSVGGALVGLLIGLTVAELLHRLYPVIPIAAPLWSIFAAVGIALATGLLFGVLPAVRAARQDPVSALARR